MSVSKSTIGCTLSACIAAEISKGATVVEAVQNAKDFITLALKTSADVSLGAGHGPLLHHLLVQ